MKVMQILPALSQGGVERVVMDLNRAVLDCGWESVVVSNGGGLVAEIERVGARHVAMDVKSKNPLSVPWRVWRLRRLLRRERPDLVCVHSRVPAWLFWFANRPLGIRWISYAHGANSVSRYSSIMTRGDAVVAPSKFLADFLRRNYRFDFAKIRVINPAVDGERFDPAKLDAAFVAAKRREWGVADTDFVVMAVGRITPIKGYEELIRSFPSDMKLVIVGGADRRHLDLERRLRGIAGGNVVFAGSQQKIPECLSLADVVVSANVRKPESFGLSVVEALAMNRPVLAKAFGGVAEIVRDGEDGMLIDDGDFAAALRQMRRRRFGLTRERALERFGYGAMLAKTRKLYLELL